MFPDSNSSLICLIALTSRLNNTIYKYTVPWPLSFCTVSLNFVELSAENSYPELDVRYGT